MPIQIYRKISPPKTENFQIKNSEMFRISAQNIDCGYSLEPPRRGGSNEYPQYMFLSWNTKNNVYPRKPQFHYIKVGFTGIKKYVFVMNYPIYSEILIFHHTYTKIWTSPTGYFRKFQFCVCMFISLLESTCIYRLCVLNYWPNGKTCRPWSICSIGAVWIGSTLFVQV